MKKLLIFSILLGSLPVLAQEILIPYKVNGKFGLADEKDKMVVEAKYDEMVWLGNDYFQAAETIQIKDQLETEPGKKVSRDHPVKLKSLIYKGKELIAPQPYSGFQVVPEMMINARFDGDAEKLSLNQKQYKNLKGKSPLYFLYNAKGENVSPEGFRRLEFVDSAGISNRNPKRAKYALLFMENFQKQFHMCVFDSDEGKIKECLFQDVTDFKVLGNDPATKKYYLDYKDSQKKDWQKVVQITKEYFTIQDRTEPLPDRKEMREQMRENQNSNPIMAAPENMQGSAPKFSHYYLEDEKLKYSNENGGGIEVKMQKSITPIWRQSKLPKQRESLIYKEGNRFGFIENGKVSDAEYDSLAYFGMNHYLACKKINVKIKCGTIDREGKTVIPMEYDSILGKMKNFELNRTSKKLELIEEIEVSPVGNPTSENSYFIKSTGNLVVYKNGKAGLMKLNNEMVLPIIYDEIGMNNLKTRGLAVHQYIVLKEKGNYGVVMSNFDSETGQTLQEIIEPIFSDFPAYYFKDYGGKKGFYLFGLMDEEGNIVSYASEIGRIFEK